MQLRKKGIRFRISTVLVVSVGVMIGICVYGCKKEEPVKDDTAPTDSGVQEPARKYTPPETSVSLEDKLYRLKITANNGSVTATPAKAGYDEGEVVELMPKPDTGYCFTGWAGDVRGKRLVLNLTMDSSKTITANFGTWQPPIGIPKPEFGISETHRMYKGRTYDFGSGPKPYKDAGDGPYTHYVDNTHRSATDSRNPYGTASKPRNTIPLDLSAGSVVEIHGGPYDYHGGEVKWTSSGTAIQPVFLRGVDDGNGLPMMLDVYAGEFFGTYFIIECLDWDTCRIFADSSSRYISIRNNDVHHHRKRSGVHPDGENIVVYNNEIHHFQTIDSVDPRKEAHGVNPGGGSRMIWIVDNHIHHNSGDGVQFGHRADGDEPEYIFVGRNIIHGDRENAIDVKYAKKVVISQNTVWSYRSLSKTEEFCFDDGPYDRWDHTHDNWDSGSDGSAIVLGSDGGPENVWVLFNDISASNKGIRVEEIHEGAWIIGNVIYNMNDTAIHYDKYGEPTYVIGNTIYNVDTALNQDRRTTVSVELRNNIFANIRGTEYGNHFNMENSAVADKSSAYNNLFWNNGNPIIIEWGSRHGHRYSTSGVMGNFPGGSGNLFADPKFIDAENNDFRLQSTSPAIDGGTLSDVYQKFFKLYGIDISEDFDGNPRPQGTAPDIGAHEFVPAPGATTPQRLN